MADPRTQNSGQDAVMDQPMQIQSSDGLLEEATEARQDFPFKSKEEGSVVSENTSCDQGEDSFSDDEDPVLCENGPRLIPFNPNLKLPREDVIMSINSGGPSLKSSSVGMDFEDDSWFQGGDTLRTEADIAKIGPSVYQSARYGNFCYKIEKLSAGDYFVDLHFAEIVFTNGPSGMRVFDVFLQEKKVLSRLDIYAFVGANTPLVFSDARTHVAEDGLLLVTFQGVQGSPILCGLCIRKASSQGPETKRRRIECPPVEEATVQLQRTGSAESYETEENTFLKRRKAPKRITEYERKIEELTKECHEAWMSLNDSNYQLEKLRSQLDNKTIHAQSVDQAVQLIRKQLEELQGKYEREKKTWVFSMEDLNAKIKLIKKDYIALAEDAHLCATAIPGISGMTNAVKSLVSQCDDLKKKYNIECMEKKLLYNKLLELKGNIRVFCRCRPLNAEEIMAGASSIVEFDTGRNNELCIRSGTTKKLFKFDRVFTPQDDQVAVFADTSPVVVSVLDGYNVCIFAYGQTGTGKTFTMEGTCQNRGVNYRTLEELFRVADERNELFRYEISVSVLEVYNEQIRDLLASPPLLGQAAKKLEIKQVAEGVHHVPGLVEARVHTMSEVWEVLQTGSGARAVGATNANEHSSRSHCLLCVMVKGENIVSGECTRSKLWLVDLAGSERVAKTDAQGERLKEAQAINKSLSALGDVISALATKSSHIPYRNSKLTHLLQDSLGGDSKTLMFVQISPHENDIAETISSLNFASRVRGVELGPARKQVDNTELLKYKQMFEKTKHDSKSKDDSLKKMEEIIQISESKLKGKEQTCKNLQERIKELEDRECCLEVKLKEQKHLAEIESMRYLKELKAKDEKCNMLKEKVNSLEAELDAKTRELRSFKSTEVVSAGDFKVLTEKQQVEETAALTEIQVRGSSDENTFASIQPEDLPNPDSDIVDLPRCSSEQKENNGRPDDLSSRPSYSSKRKVATFDRATAASTAKTLSTLCPKNETAECLVINKADTVMTYGSRNQSLDGVHLYSVRGISGSNNLVQPSRRKEAASARLIKEKTTAQSSEDRTASSANILNAPRQDQARFRTSSALAKPVRRARGTVNSQRTLDAKERDAKVRKWGR